MSDGWHRASDGLVSTVRNWATKDRTVLYAGMYDNPPEVWLPAEEGSRTVAAHVAIQAIDRMLAVAAPVWWSGEMARMLAAISTGMPDFSMAQHLLPSYDGFMWFDETIAMPEVYDDDWIAIYGASPPPQPSNRQSTSKLRAIAWTLIEVVEHEGTDQRFDARPRISQPGAPRTVVFAPIVEVEGQPRLASMTTWTLGESYGKIREGEERLIREDSSYLWAKRIYEIFGSAMLLMNQRIVQHHTMPMPRHAQKRAERALGRVPDVRVVKLRRQQTRYDERTDDPPVEWSCRWLVTGHWRSQEHLGEGREPIYILPHIKGPDGLPLRLPPGKTVFEVVR